MVSVLVEGVESLNDRRLRLHGHWQGYGFIDIALGYIIGTYSLFHVVCARDVGSVGLLRLRETVFTVDF